ncbi:hypothetical protein ACQR1I_13615 [Bradyrhizobium sp. HKCCYLS2038]|uniref:hypothetical protein n=1 Tax=unclassified Bradyrhizobium TaxID=2631580 RepID=UPI003EBD848F
MQLLEKIAFSDIETSERCSLVKHGEIVQFSHLQETHIGIRTFFDDPMGGKEAVFIIGGPDHGHLLSLDLIGNPAALIITKLVRFVAVEPAPFIVGRTSTAGELYQQNESGAFLASGVVVDQSVRRPAYVYLTPEGEQFGSGHCLAMINPGRWRGISHRFEVEVLPDRTS